MDTPLGALAVDEDAVAQLAATGKFARVGRDDDEAEHRCVSCDRLSEGAAVY